jgi:hypothetical protein
VDKLDLEGEMEVVLHQMETVPWAVSIITIRDWAKGIRDGLALRSQSIPQGGTVNGSLTVGGGSEASPRPSALVWSREKPKEPGFYWVHAFGDDLELVRICDGGARGYDELVVEDFSGGFDLLEGFSPHCKWHGPIPEPSEAESARRGEAPEAEPSTPPVTPVAPEAKIGESHG